MRLALVLVLAAACAGSAAPSTAPVPATPTPLPATAQPVQAEPAKPAASAFPGVPGTRAGRELAWVLDVLVHKKGVVTKAEVEQRFDAKFLASVPADQMVETLAALGGQTAGLELVSVKGEELRLVAKIAVEGEPLTLLVALDAGSNKIVGLLIRPDADAAPRPKTFEEAIAMTEKLAPKAQLLVAAVDNGRCKPLHATGPNEALAIGSTFKLYVLLGLVDRILAGKAKWDDELAVRDDWKSLPSGVTQNEAAGTKLSLREHAKRMISISDNTATDHLLYFLGRKQVEAALRSTKHGKPALNTPFFGTRELFWLKLGMTDEDIETYRKLPEAKRRAFLDKDIAGKVPDIAKAEGWKSARRIDQLEWFATPADLCGAMATLQRRSTKGAGKDLLAVLSENPGIELDKQAWRFIGYKGGSEPGVINLTWLLERADGKWFVVVVTANAPEGVVEEAKALGVAHGVLELLGNAAASPKL